MTKLTWGELAAEKEIERAAFDTLAKREIQYGLQVVAIARVCAVGLSGHPAYAALAVPAGTPLYKGKEPRKSRCTLARTGDVQAEIFIYEVPAIAAGMDPNKADFGSGLAHRDYIWDLATAFKEDRPQVPGSTIRPLFRSVSPMAISTFATAVHSWDELKAVADRTRQHPAFEQATTEYLAGFKRAVAGMVADFMAAAPGDSLHQSLVRAGVIGQQAGASSRPRTGQQSQDFRL